MIEKVNPAHPDKVADRIAGAIVDLAYKIANDPKIAVEVLIGHGHIMIVIETDTKIGEGDIESIVHRIAGHNLKIELVIVPQDIHLSENQIDKYRCGDNGIFRGVPLTKEELAISELARNIYANYPTDGKYIIADKKLIICQSNVSSRELHRQYPDAIINPIGEWTGGTEVDAGATNRKLGSDMAQSVTGGGLHGKDLSKADVSVNIYAFLKAQETGNTVELHCAIGDDTIDGLPYEEIVKIARNYIKEVGGFEKFAEWGLF